MTINWERTEREDELIQGIAFRAFFETKKKCQDFRRVIEMDISACHLNDVEIDLKKLLGSDSNIFLHDVMGIHNNICRESGKLKNCFLPKTSMK